MTIIKICGITNLADAQMALEFGADELGFNFYSKSPRYIHPDSAAAIIEGLDNEFTAVGVFVNEKIGSVIRIAETVGLRAIQFHGDETEEYLADAKRRISVEIIRAFRAGPDFDRSRARMSSADSVLLDAYSANEYGGTGKAIDLSAALAVRQAVAKMYLAGGLSPENVASAVAFVSPFAVDVCSGVEAAKGIKHENKLRRFISEVKTADKNDSRSLNK